MHTLLGIDAMVESVIARLEVQAVNRSVPEVEKGTLDASRVAFTRQGPLRRRSIRTPGGQPTEQAGYCQRQRS